MLSAVLKGVRQGLLSVVLKSRAQGPAWALSVVLKYTRAASPAAQWFPRLVLSLVQHNLSRKKKFLPSRNSWMPLLLALLFSLLCISF